MSNLFRYASSGSVTWLIICMVLAIAAAIVICVLILPAKRRGTLTGFLLWLHDMVNFNILIVEKLMKILYIFAACFTIFFGLFVLFTGSALAGLLIIVLGSVLVRVLYEFSMLIIIGVNNLIQLNRKTPGDASAPKAQPAAPAAASYTQPQQPQQAPRNDYYSQAPVQAPVQPAAPAPRMVYCTQCGTRYDANQGHCPNCGSGSADNA